MNIVFATTCKQRTQHLQKTLPKNLADNSSSKSKFVLLDYGSQDHLLPYLKGNHQDAIASGKLVVYSFIQPGPFHMAHAKNMAHRLAILEGADIIVNLDADNFTGPDFDTYIARQFEPNQRIFLWSGMVKGQGKKLRGTSGRIVVTTNAFLKAGGYDEKYDTWAPDDKDFNARLQKLDYTPQIIDRQYLEAVPHKDGLRFEQYPHARPAEDSGDEPELAASDGAVVNYGNFGCGTVIKNFDSPPIELKPLPTRIFGIGMHKTATSSLHQALKMMQFDSGHWESGRWARAIWNEMNTLGRSRTLEKHYALSDLPITILYKKLDAAYPGSKFILTIRSDFEWLQSMENHWSYVRNPFRWEWDVYPFSNVLHKHIYGRTDFDATTMLKRYRQHNAEVRSYFKHRPQDLLVLDMSKNHGWSELCQFLNRPIPAVPYPTANKSKPNKN